MHAQPMLMMRAVARTSALAGLAVVVGACLGQAGTPAISIGEGTTVQPSPTSSASGLAKPEIPVGFPVMPGMRVDDPLPGDPGLIGRWTTSSDGAEVFSFLEAALPEAGYRVDLLGPGGTAAVIRFTPPGGKQLQIDIGQEGSGTFMELRLPRD